MKLTEEQVQDIFLNTTRTQAQLASQYGVTDSHICRIVKGLIRRRDTRHLTPPNNPIKGVQPKKRVHSAEYLAKQQIVAEYLAKKGLTPNDNE